jgi:hypothetical protein
MIPLLLMMLMMMVSGLPGWQQLGSSITHSRIVAVSASVDAVLGPLIAYGASDSPDDTTTRILSFQANGSSWVQIGSHTPQFGQPYEHFDLRVRQAVINIGIVINPSDVPAAGLSSVLRNVSGGGSGDGYEGCYAFPAYVWDFDLSQEGDVRAIISPDNRTIGFASYASSGFSSYPASNAWTDLTIVARPIAGVAAISAVRGGNEALLFAWADGAGALLSGLTPLTASSNWLSTGSPFNSADSLIAGTSPAIAWAGNVTCVSGLTRDGLKASCAREYSAAWSPTFLVISGADARYAPGMSMQAFPDGTANVVFAAVAGAAIKSVRCLLPPSGSAQCEPPFPDKSFSFGINAFSLRGASDEAPILVVSSGPADGSGDFLSAFALSEALPETMKP